MPPEWGERVMAWVASPPGIEAMVTIAVDPRDGE
jgi:hypothetical protein